MLGWVWLCLMYAGDETGPKISVPTMVEPTLDNTLSPGEWENAAVFELPGGGRILLGSGQGVLYLAASHMPEAKVGFGCVFLFRDSEVWVLHASAQLGSARYLKRGEGWQPENQEYTWKKAEVMWAEEHWRAGVNPERTQEFAISGDLLGPNPVIAFGYVFFPDRKAQAIGWPPNLADATRDTKLLSGWNPDNLVFDTAGWARLAFP